MTNRLPLPVKRLADELSKLPGIGPRQAIRLAFFLIHEGQNSIHALATEIDNLKNIKVCSRCFYIHENLNNLCDICGDPKHDQKVIMIVEKDTDLLSLENTRKFNGRYFILGTISKTGILDDSQKLRIQSLKAFIQKELGGKANEIIIALNPSNIGEFNTLMLKKELNDVAEKISRLGRGLPTGGEIEFADDETLGAALERRG